VVDAGVPPEVRRFIEEHIGSVAQLEILLLLHARGGTELSAEAVARELRVEPRWAAAELRELTAHGLFEERSAPEPLYRFAPPTPELARAVVLLADAYRQRRVTVINLIFEKPSKNIRVFADAFRLRKD
jgi:hypothetical protein